mmetsp:Transcript_20210/g.49059  ORF Transcript_20210/g.49059 Transcript_20210/m.49059 type:complete len:81 (+) Transcript_20210:955-1197(+)
MQSATPSQASHDTKMWARYPIPPLSPPHIQPHHIHHMSAIHKKQRERETYGHSSSLQKDRNKPARHTELSASVCLLCGRW